MRTGRAPARSRTLAVGALLLTAGLLSLVLHTLADDDPPVEILSSAGPIGEGAEELAGYGGQVTVRDLIMDAHGGGEISGYIVRPKRLTRPTAAVVLLHGRDTDASDLVIEGALLAQLGAIAIVPDNAYVRLGPVDGRGLETMRKSAGDAWRQPRIWRTWWSRSRMTLVSIRAGSRSPATRLAAISNPLSRDTCPSPPRSTWPLGRDGFKIGP